MAKVKLMTGILSVHGKIGSYCYRTYKNGTVVLSRMPRKSDKEQTEAQKKQQERFGSVARKVNEVMKDPTQREVMELLYKNHGRRNETLRGFVFRQINGLYPK
jgi:type I restriction-modification system DNA methylase subunit